MAKLSDNIEGMEYVEQCGICQGDGEYEQTYTVGCGGGMYRSMGRCDYCDGIGIRMTDNSKVPNSVIAQITQRATP